MRKKIVCYLDTVSNMAYTRDEDVDGGGFYIGNISFPYESFEEAKALPPESVSDLLSKASSRDLIALREAGLL